MIIIPFDIILNHHFFPLVNLVNWCEHYDKLTPLVQCTRGLDYRVWAYWGVTALLHQGTWAHISLILHV